MRALSAALATLGILLVLVGQTADAGITPDATVIRPLATHVEAPLPPVTALPAVPAREMVLSAVHGVGRGAPDATAEEFTVMVQRYCMACHNDALLTGNLSLMGFEVEKAPEMAETAERMIRKLRAGMMPPAGMPRPGGDTLMMLVRELETRIDEDAARNPNPGWRTFQRLNRAEYANAVRDLLGLEIDVGTFLPLDTKSANFDNIADVQMPSATVMEGYMRAANHISRMALGDPDAEPNSTRYRLPRTASQKDRVEGAPFGTRGGVSVIHNFPADGKYVFHIQPYPAVEGEVFGRTFGNVQIEVSIDGARVAFDDRGSLGKL